MIEPLPAQVGEDHVFDASGASPFALCSHDPMLSPAPERRDGSAERSDGLVVPFGISLMLDTVMQRRMRTRAVDTR